MNRTKRMTAGALFFFNDTATTEIYTLSLHDALPIFYGSAAFVLQSIGNITVVAVLFLLAVSLSRGRLLQWLAADPRRTDRKSTRLNSSHANISYAVFCLKKKTNTHIHLTSSLLAFPP